MCEIMEALGGDSVWVGDHVVIPFGFRTGYPYAAAWYDPHDPPAYWEAFSVLAYLAARTTCLRIGTSVLVLPYRHPLLTAKMLATADVLSGGRLMFGAGVGWFEDEFLALGLSTFGERGAVADEQLEIIRRCWTENRPSFDGVHYRFGELSVLPKPVQRPHPPILIGGTGRAALRRAARYGDFWHATSMLPDEVAAGRASLAVLAGEHGRPVPGISLFMKIILTATPSAYDEFPAGRRREAIVGTPEQVAGQLRAYEESGVEQLISRIGSDGSFGSDTELLARFLTEVWPSVSPRPAPDHPPAAPGRITGLA
jgi:probable F420-dependent oxidoreductase